MLSIEEALGAILPAFKALGREQVALGEALGRIVAVDLLGRDDSPSFDNSAMDGYAVRAADVTAASRDTPVELTVASESRAGGPSPPELTKNNATRIFTGAPMPPGADAVVMQEDSEREQGRVKIMLAPKPGAHVRRRGEDLAAGTVMLARGARVGPGEIGLLASQSHATVSVHRRPTVAIVSNGDELVELGAPLRPGAIINSNAHALAAQVTQAGAIPWVLPTAPDDLDAITASFVAAISADVVISCGGVSVGDHDLVHQAFERASITAQFWKVAIKPGKPLTFGLGGGDRRVPVIGLPGNPVSAMVTFEVFVRPGLRIMLGDRRPHRATVTVTLGSEVRHGTGRTELMRATLSEDGSKLVAHPHRRQGSGALPSMVSVDALLILSAQEERFDAGSEVLALLLADDRGSTASPFAPGEKGVDRGAGPRTLL